MIDKAVTVEISRLELRAGQSLVVKADLPITHDQAERIKNYFGQCVPDGVKVLVIDKRITLQALDPSPVPDLAD